MEVDVNARMENREGPGTRPCAAPSPSLAFLVLSDSEFRPNTNLVLQRNLVDQSEVPWFFYLLIFQIPLILLEHQLLSFSDLLLMIKDVDFALRLIDFYFFFLVGF